MKYSVEVRLPFQAISLVEFFIAMLKKYRFKKDLGKYYLRKYEYKILMSLFQKHPSTQWVLLYGKMKKIRSF